MIVVHFSISCQYIFIRTRKDFSGNSYTGFVWRPFQHQVSQDPGVDWSFGIRMCLGRFFESADDGICTADRRGGTELAWKFSRKCSHGWSWGQSEDRSDDSDYCQVLWELPTARVLYQPDFKLFDFLGVFPYLTLPYLSLPDLTPPFKLSTLQPDHRILMSPLRRVQQTQTVSLSPSRLLYFLIFLPSFHRVSPSPPTSNHRASYQILSQVE